MRFFWTSKTWGCILNWFQDIFWLTAWYHCSLKWSIPQINWMTDSFLRTGWYYSHPYRAPQTPLQPQSRSAHNETSANSFICVKFCFDCAENKIWRTRPWQQKQLFLFWTLGHRIGQNWLLEKEVNRYSFVWTFVSLFMVLLWNNISGGSLVDGYPEMFFNQLMSWSNDSRMRKKSRWWWSMILLLLWLHT